MGGVSRSELVVAVSNAGGYGFLGMVRESPEKIASEIQQVRENTGCEFGVNIIPAATRPDLLERQVALCIEMQVASVCLFWDVHQEIIKRLTDAGIIVVHQVGTLEDAEAALSAGVHVLIAQGVEAGGHVRGTLPLQELLSRILQVSHVPVLAAGGIVSGHDLASVLQAGAEGAVVGTAFLATNESFAHDFHKNEIINSRDDETVLTDLFRINWPFGALTRVIDNGVIKTTGDENKIIIGEFEGNPVYLHSTDSPLRTTTGNLEAMPIYAGCGAYRINQIVSADTRVKTMISEARVVLSGSCNEPDINPVEVQNYSSPCYAHELDLYPPAREDRNDGLIEFLELLLAAERAGARVSMRSLIECDNDEYRHLFQSIYSDESRWCRMLIEWLKRLDHVPEFVIGDFYQKAMAIKDLKRRIEYFNRGQIWVVKTIRDMLPDISIVQLQEDLHDMLTSHVVNIAQANIGSGFNSGVQSGGLVQSSSPAGSGR